MQFVADLHLHSKYSRAVSQDMVLPTMATWAAKKGIDILTTGDWTHPLWFREIRSQLEEVGDGVYRLRTTDYGKKSVDGSQNAVDKKKPLFLLTVEVASIYSQGGKLRRIHNLIFAPNLETADKINKELARRGANLLSDGRPMMGISSTDIIELVLGIDKRAMIIPCHAWTPWFSLYGSMSGFDSIEECFGEYARYIYAVETGLSSNPAMNWRIADLNTRSILSFSDAHSPAKMGREATVFETSDESGVISYETITRAITMNSEPITHNFPRIAYTIEFYPEEGKYHYTGHRNCKVVHSPQDSARHGTKCPVCGRNLTVGVMHRVEQLARLNKQSAKGGQANNEQIDKFGVKWIKNESRPPYIMLVPLLEILAEALSSTTTSVRVREAFDLLVDNFGSEINVLLRTDSSNIEKVAGKKVREGIEKVRSGKIFISPGFDGEYGKVKIWREGEDVAKDVDNEESENKQLGLF